MQRYPRVSNKKVVKRKRFNTSQVIFIKYLDAYDLYDEIGRLRRHLRIHDHGFTDTHQIDLWLKRKGQGEFFDKACLKFLGKNDLPHNFYNLLRDYVLTGFRFDVCLRDEYEAVCVLSSPEKHSDAPHYILRVHDGVKISDIKKFIKQYKKEIESILEKQRRISLGPRPTTSKAHNRDRIVKSYKELNKKDLIEKYWFDREEKEEMLYGKVTKLAVIKRLLKRDHNIIMSLDMIDKL